MSSFTTKTNFWGNKIYYDERGNEIGKEESSIFGGRGIYKNGHKVADLDHDYNGNEELVFKSNSLFGSDKRMTDKNRHEDWEFCDECGEWDGGEDGDCPYCGHH